MSMSNNHKPFGGTEILYSQLQSVIDLKNVNVIVSSCDPSLLDSTKPNILWQHHSYDQAAVAGIINSSFVEQLDYIVFVSHWQKTQYLERFKIPKEKCIVLQNATTPCAIHQKPTEKIRLIYTSTPWRGLETLIKVYKKLNRSDIELVVYSGTSIYGKEFYQANHHKYESLYNELKKLPNTTHIEYATNKAIRRALQSAHIFAYPNTWEETSCLAAIEALTAGCKVVTTQLGALPETCGGWADFVPISDNLVEEYTVALNDAIDNFWSTENQDSLSKQVDYYNNNWTWPVRTKQWQTFLDNYNLPIYYSMVNVSASKEYTKPALDSFFRTTILKPNDKFFLIDNDNSLTEKYPNVTLVKNSTPKTFAENVNQILSAAIDAHADFIFLSNDVLFTENWNEPLHQRRNGIKVPNCNSTPLSLGDPLPNIPQAMGHTSPKLIPFFCFFIPNHIAKIVGLFDEQFINGAEDVDYRVRADSFGFPTEVILESYVYHYIGKSTWLSGEPRSETDKRNQDYTNKFLNKWGEEITSKYLLNYVPKAKTCIYAIALNEIKHVDKFMESCKDADMVMVCDTGSTDGTPERLRELGAIVYNINQTPWRFDTARNIALSLIPTNIDLCLSIDLDEYLQPGWNEVLQDIWKASRGKVNRIRYDYIWSWNSDGTPGGRFYASKIHSRQGYHWHYPCHEIVQWCGPDQEIAVTADKLQLQHHADATKSRSNYLNLLYLGITEEPYSDRARYYYARELMFNRKWTEAIEHFKIHIGLPSATWKEERAASYRHMSHCLRQLGNNAEAFEAAIQGMLEWNQTREPWMEIARSAYALKDWPTCYWAATKALAIASVSTTYVSDPTSWGYEPYDLAALGAYNLGLHHEAVKHGSSALGKVPDDARLKSNLDFYTSKLEIQVS